MQRVEGPVVDLPGGVVTFDDPGFLAFVEVRTTVRLPRGRDTTEVGVLDLDSPGRPGERVRRAAVMALGDTRAVEARRPVLDPSGGPFRFPVDAGMGCAFGPDDLPALAAAVEAFDDLVRGVEQRVAVPVEVGGRVAAVVFDCGRGDGAYPVFVGHDTSGRAVAVAADLELHHHAAEAIPSPA